MVDVPDGYALYFSDEFDYGSVGSPADPDGDKWGVESWTPAGYAYVDGTKLSLRATATSVANHESAEMRSSDLGTINYWNGALGISNALPTPGFLEVRMKPSEHTGVASGLWWYSDWQESPVGSDIWRFVEVDVLEALGYQPGSYYSGTQLWSRPAKTAPGRVIHQADTATGSTGQYHTWKVWFGETFVQVYLDDVLAHERDFGPDMWPAFGWPISLILSIYIGQDGDGWAGAEGVDYPIDTTIDFDYVRYYTPPEHTEVISPTAIEASTNLSGAVTAIDEQPAGAGSNFAEDWTGSNGDPWDAAKWPYPEVASSSVIDIQSNAGRMSATGAAYTYARMISAEMEHADFELTATFTLTDLGEEYHLIAFRAANGWFGADVTDGYMIECYYYNGSTQYLNLIPITGGSRGSVTQVAWSWNTDPWSLRILAVGSAIKVKVWQGAEPAAWTIEITNSAHASGYLAFRAGNGNATTARTITWDDLVLRPLRQDSDALTATDPTASTSVRVSFPTPP